MMKFLLSIETNKCNHKFHATHVRAHDLDWNYTGLVNRQICIVPMLDATKEMNQEQNCHYTIS